jgi:hypothetical protein
MWLWERLRGKHDLVSVRANLRSLPAREFEIVPLAGPLRKKLDDAAAHPAAGEVPGHPFTWHELSNGLGFGMRGAMDEATCEKAKIFAATYGAYVERISLRKRKPHAMAFFHLGAIEKQSSAEVWKALGELAKG